MKRNNSLSFIIFILLAPILSELIGFSSLHAQTVDENLWVTNGTVIAIVRSGNTIYLGGLFTYVGPPTGSGAAIDINTGNPNLPFEKVNGSINAVVPDGAGGWYIGGDFTMVNSVARNNIARINANGTLNGSWGPDANDVVYALAVSGSTVYAGGKFTSIGGQTRNYIAALDATTGTATTWNPNASNVVSALAVSGSSVYASGAFTSIGGQTRNYIASIDAATGTATSWNPNASNVVNALAVSGSTVFAGGDFTSIGGQTRNYIAALDTVTGTATSWNPDAGGFSPSVYALAASGSTVYAGGSFNSIGGQTRNRIAALDTATGTATSWNPNSSSIVRVVKVSGPTVYAGGGFTGMGNTVQSHFAGISTSTTSVLERQEIPSEFGLYQNYPNPFNPTTTISYQLPVASNARLVVYDLLGREVSVLVNERQAPGSYEVRFEGSHLSSGVYFYRLQAGTYVETRKLLLLR